jgi:pimeloyl-ACP methyl ester carboxylesterase
MHKRSFAQTGSALRERDELPAPAALRRTRLARVLGVARRRRAMRVRDHAAVEPEQHGFAERVRRAAAEAPVLLFVHGLGCDTSFWDEAWSWPGLEPYTLVAVDLPGFGASPPLRPFTFEAVVGRLARVVESAPAPVVAVGHSMGGTIAALLAARAPVRGAVLVEANLVPVGPESSASAAGALARSEGQFDEWFDEFARQMEEAAADDASTARYVRSLERADRQTFGEACTELVAAAAGVGERYADLSVPRVYVVGSDEEPAHIAFLEDHGLEIVRIADAGHSVTVDQPAAFYGFLESWVGGVVSRPHG